MESVESNMKSEYEPYWSNYLKQFDIPNKMIKIPEETKKYCVIVECRIHKNLIYVIKNYM